MTSECHLLGLIGINQRGFIAGEAIMEEEGPSPTRCWPPQGTRVESGGFSRQTQCVGSDRREPERQRGKQMVASLTWGQTERYSNTGLGGTGRAHRMVNLPDQYSLEYSYALQTYNFPPPLSILQQVDLSFVYILLCGPCSSIRTLISCVRTSSSSFCPAGSR